MKDTFIQARLVQKDLIRVSIFTATQWNSINAFLRVDRRNDVKLHQTRMSSVSGAVILDYKLEGPLSLGHGYSVVVGELGVVPLDVSEATTFPGFDEDFYYAGDDLGTTYSKEKTTFVIWAPLASMVIVKCRKANEKTWSLFEAKREDRGIYRLELKGDHKGLYYRYLITNNGVTNETTDIYAKCSTANGEESVVCDFKELEIDMNRDKVSNPIAYTESIIYETHVRDFTISSKTNIENKGKFLGIAEEGRKSKKGHPAGLDYLSYLGITHLQLLPIFDYKTVDEIDPSTKYNWGYDPAQFFVPEGSYASNVLDPLSRISDLKKMVSKLHERGIRVVMDVVFNHVYEFQSSVFEKTVPNFYFRRRHDGKMSNCSGCGNDLATERPMVRKMILDCCKWWQDVYSIDGFRFDLMGLIDCDTLNMIRHRARKKDPYFLVHGEGWDMWGDAKVPSGKMGNYFLMPEYAFFNDNFREDLRKYSCGDLGVVHYLKGSFFGNAVDMVDKARFDSARRSTNYIECHDDYVFFDYLSSRRGDLSLEDKLEVVKMANAVTLLSIGIPFIHMGQEYGQSKFGERNTYNKGDYYNKMSYELRDERWDMVEEVASLIKWRRSHEFSKIYESSVIDSHFFIEDINGIIKVTDTFVDRGLNNPVLYINPTSEDVYVEKDKERLVLVDNSGVIKERKTQKETLVKKHSIILVSDPE
ncbi:MAG: type I pullulanase [Bacilli bacterium]|nr:type I pullulanase [Bacilli bacterium]